MKSLSGGLSLWRLSGRLGLWKTCLGDYVFGGHVWETRLERPTQVCHTLISQRRDQDSFKWITLFIYNIIPLRLQCEPNQVNWPKRQTSWSVSQLRDVWWQISEPVWRSIIAVKVIHRSSTQRPSLRGYKRSYPVWALDDSSVVPAYIYIITCWWLDLDSRWPQTVTCPRAPARFLAAQISEVPQGASRLLVALAIKLPLRWMFWSFIPIHKTPHRPLYDELEYIKYCKNIFIPVDLSRQLR